MKGACMSPLGQGKFSDQILFLLKLPFLADANHLGDVCDLRNVSLCLAGLASSLRRIRLLPADFGGSTAAPRSRAPQTDSCWVLATMKDNIAINAL